MADQVAAQSELLSIEAPTGTSRHEAVLGCDDKQTSGVVGALEQGSDGGAALWVMAGAVAMMHACKLQSHTSPPQVFAARGGAVLVATGGELLAVDTVFKDNYVQGDGGGVFVEEAPAGSRHLSAAFFNCSFEGNS
eukprot:gene25650-31366_t